MGWLFCISMERRLWMSRFIVGFKDCMVFYIVYSGGGIGKKDIWDDLSAWAKK